MKTTHLLSLLLTLTLLLGIAPTARSSEPLNALNDAEFVGQSPLGVFSDRSRLGVYDLEMVGSNGGVTRAVFVQGNYAYIGEGARLTILDVSTPTLPVMVGQTSILSDTVQDVYVSGNYAYVIDRDLHVIDVSDPTQPTKVGFYDTPWGSAPEVHVHDDIAYIASGRLSIVDVSNPANPTELGRIDAVHDMIPFTNVYVTGTIAYLASEDYEDPGGDRLEVWDVSDPSSPTRIASRRLADIRDIYVSGDMAYLACAHGDFASGRLEILDVSNPASPTDVGVHAIPGNTQSVYVSGDIAYVTDYSNGLRIIDVSDPAHPTELALYEIQGGGPVDVRVSGHTAYVSSLSSGLWLVDISNPSAPNELGFYGRLEYANKIDVYRGIAYMVDDWGKLGWFPIP